MTYQADIHQYERLLASLAHKAVRRAEAAGIVVEFDELFQEAKITFFRARDLFEPEHGVKFSTYLWRAVRNNLNALSKKAGFIQSRTDSLDRTIGEDEEGSLHDVIPASIETMDERLERLEAESEMFSRLSPEARMVVAVLDSPPPELVKEIRRMEAFRKLCVEKGKAAANRQLDVQTVCAALGFDQRTTRNVKREFKAIMEEVYG